MEGSSTVPQGYALVISPAMGTAVEDASAKRECKMFGEREPPDIDNCIAIVSRQFLDLRNRSPHTISRFLQIIVVICNMILPFSLRYMLCEGMQ